MKGKLFGDDDNEDDFDSPLKILHYHGLLAKPSSPKQCNLRSNKSKCIDRQTIEREKMNGDANNPLSSLAVSNTNYINNSIPSQPMNKSDYDIFLKFSEEEHIYNCLIESSQKKINGVLYTVLIDLKLECSGDVPLGIGLKFIKDNIMIVNCVQKNSSWRFGPGGAAGIRLGDMLLGIDYKVCLLKDNEPSVMLWDLFLQGKKQVSLQLWRCRQVLREAAPGHVFASSADDTVLHTLSLHTAGLVTHDEYCVMIEGVLRDLEEELGLISSPSSSSTSMSNSSTSCQGSSSVGAATGVGRTPEPAVLPASPPINKDDLIYRFFRAKRIRHGVSTHILQTKNKDDCVNYIIYVSDVCSGLYWTVEKRFQEFSDLYYAMIELCPSLQAFLEPPSRTGVNAKAAICTSSSSNMLCTSLALPITSSVSSVMSQLVSVTLSPEALLEQRLSSLETLLNTSLRLLSDLVEEPLVAYMDMYEKHERIVVNCQDANQLNNAVMAMKYMLNFLNLPTYLDCQDPPSPTPLQWMEWAAFRCLNDSHSLPHEHCQEFLSSVDLEDEINKGVGLSGHRPMLALLNQSVQNLCEVMRTEMGRQLRDIYWRRLQRKVSVEADEEGLTGVEGTDDLVNLLIARCIRRQAEVAIFLPLRRTVFRLVHGYLLLQSRRLQTTLKSLRGSSPTTFLAHPLAASTGSFHEAVSAFRDVFRSVLPLDQGHKLVFAAQAVFTVFTECQQALSSKSFFEEVNTYISDDDIDGSDIEVVHIQSTTDAESVQVHCGKDVLTLLSGDTRTPTDSEREGNGEGDGGMCASDVRLDSAVYQKRESTAATIDESEGDGGMGADSFLPLFTYVLVQAEVAQLLVASEVMAGLVDPEERLGECGYFLTTLLAASHYILQLGEAQKMTVTISSVDERVSVPRVHLNCESVSDKDPMGINTSLNSSESDK